MSAAGLVCAHGKPTCSFCGTETVAPWRRTLGRFLSRSSCPCCGRRARRPDICASCSSAGFVPLRLFEVDHAA